ncbi:ArnT family glycosyltransferase [Streptomyces physcomitrii]|uniref:Phospholipid carrier-dependent glycosyltransferase n=1 Tax=Streptomyces physcomitrii TaxID=2724184 RepID=A0ABX1H6A8_9ACTN|nr:glycosyltransferase family 39 protein [Streptomyces physcomitrii]NKI43613.1 phospholipid carrier-dependent glycosyltransferase [Streptomyces physcomitrii]
MSTAATGPLTGAAPAAPGGTLPARRVREVPGTTWAVAAATATAFLLAFWAVGRTDPHYYYAAAARSMSGSWRNFWFGAYDPAGSLTVDKVPGALWFPALSVRLFGAHTWALLLPQALAAALTVPVLHSAVRRWAGPAAGAAAAAVFALSPVTVVLARVDIPDTFLVLFLVCAARSASRALQEDRRGPLLAAALWVGAAFHIKMAAAYLVLPALALAYGVAAAGSLRRRLGRLALAGAVVLASSAVWPLSVALTPAAHRPYVDGSAHNSVWEMLLHYNGLSRFTDEADLSGGSLASFLTDFGGPPGVFRLTGGQLGPEVGWLLPLAVAAALAGLLARRGRPRTDPVRAGWLLWGTWLLVHAVVLSAARAVHPYYTAALVPAVAALTGAGLVLAARAWTAGTRPGPLLPLAVLLGGAWAVVLSARGEAPLWQSTLVAAVTVSAAAVLAAGPAVLRGRGAGTPADAGTPAESVTPADSETPAAFEAAAESESATDSRPAVTQAAAPDPVTATARAAAPAVLTRALALAAVALLCGPGLWALSASGRPFTGLTGLNPVSARSTTLPAPAMAALHGFPPDLRLPPEMGTMNMTAPHAGLLAYTEAHHRGERYVLAVPTANTAAPYLRAGRSVLPMGGFTGAAPVPSTAGLARLVSSGELRYVMTGGFHGAMGGRPARERQGWVAGHCAEVPPARYRSQHVSGPPGAPERLWDCAAAGGER